MTDWQTAITALGGALIGGILTSISGIQLSRMETARQASKLNNDRILELQKESRLALGEIASAYGGLLQAVNVRIQREDDVSWLGIGQALTGLGIALNKFLVLPISDAVSRKALEVNAAVENFKRAPGSLHLLNPVGDRLLELQALVRTAPYLNRTSEIADQNRGSG